MMHLNRRATWLAGAFACSLFVAHYARALAPVGDPVALGETVNDDEFRTGGCSGCFFAQVHAALANFDQVVRIYRTCVTKGGAPVMGDADSDACDGNGGGKHRDFVVIEGTLKQCAHNPCQAGDLGVEDPTQVNPPGNIGSTNVVTYRVGSHGSSRGIASVRKTPNANGVAVTINGIGQLAPEGFDGISGTADDAGGMGDRRVAGPGRTLVGGNCTGPAPTVYPTDWANTCAFPMVDLPGCTGLDDGSFTKAAGFKELCVLNWDTTGDGNVDRERDGDHEPTFAGPIAIGAGNETVNTKLYSDTGFADLPTQDFVGTLALDQFDNNDVFGAQIFKLIASKDVHGTGGATQKIELNDPVVELLFKDPGATGICNWADVGGTSGGWSDPTLPAPSTGAAGAVNTCIRSNGSGTKETFRNTWLANTGGNQAEAIVGSGDNLAAKSGNCLQIVEGGAPRVTAKRIGQATTTRESEDCVENFGGSVAYVDADRTGNYYGVPVEGVDPDTNSAQLKTLVKCGKYRWWGPLAGGRAGNGVVLNPALTQPGRANAVATQWETSHLRTLKIASVFTTFPAYLPLGGVGVTKTRTDGAYNLSFAPTGCPAQPTAIGTIP